MQVVSLGDLALDVVVRVESDVARDADTPARVSLSAGGQGANVAAWAAALGASARWVGKRGGDAAGRLAAETLQRLGVELVGPVEKTGNGVVVSLVDSDGARSMFPDRGVARLLEPVELRAPWLACDHLHVSGYALLAEPVVRAAVRAIDLARVSGARISIDLSSWTHVRAYGRTMRPALARVAPDVVFGNEREWDELGALDTTTRVVKRGARGITVDGADHAARDGDVVDTTGAGDALAAGFLVGGPEVALEAAARCVAQVGAMP